MMSAMISGCSRASLHPTGRGVEADLADFSRGEMFHVGVCVALMNVRAALFWLRSPQNKAPKTQLPRRPFNQRGRRYQLKSCELYCTVSPRIFVQQALTNSIGL